MTAIIKSIHKFENSFDKKTERFAIHHPYIAFATIFIGMPLFILMIVTIATMILVLPVSWIFGWL